MDPTRWKRLRELFDVASELAPEERRTYLQNQCPDDEDMRAEVESLVVAGQDDRIIGGVISDAAMNAGDTAPADLAGKRFGSYELVRELGRGGMGMVFLARRADEQYEKNVAIKLIRGIESSERLRWFRRERQILATLDHPNIARLLDGGETEDGLPYLVMEYVEGQPIDEYCDRNRLTIRDRLVLFREVCSAFRFAHSNLVVHRDVKPGNVLVTEDGTPKLLDFGIAKLIDPEAFAGDHTATMARALTPAYASPEQIRGGSITTASDIYSLGVMLYELLTGQRPHVINTTNPAEIEHIVCDTDPERPSTVVGATAGESVEERTGATVSEARRTQPARLHRELKGDIDNIVLMALRKEPERRYASAEQFADDIQRYLEGRPVIALPDTAGYRFSKFVRRNKIGVATAAAISVILVASSIISFALYRRAEHEKQLAVEAQVEAEESARTAEEVTGFMLKLLKNADPDESEGREMTVREVIDIGAATVREELEDQAPVRARVMRMIGVVYQSLGHPDKARPLLEDALEITRVESADDPETVADALMNLGDLILETAKDGEALPLYLEAIELREKALGSDHPKVASLLNRVGLTLQYEHGDLTGALPYYERSLAIQEKALGPEHVNTAYYTNILGIALRDLGRFAEAREYYERTLAIREKHLKPNDTRLAATLSAYGGLLNDMGKYDKSVPLLERSAAIREEVLGPDHAALARSLEFLADARTAAGKFDEAETLYNRALTIYKKQYGSGAAVLWHSTNGLAYLEKARDNDIGSRQLFQQAKSICENTYGEDHQNMAYTLQGLGQLDASAGNYAGATDRFERSIIAFEKSVGREHPRVADVLDDYADTLRRIGRDEDANRCENEAREIRAKSVQL